MAKRTILAPVLILLGVYLILNQGGSLGPGTIFRYLLAHVVRDSTRAVLPLAVLLHDWQRGWTAVPGGLSAHGRYRLSDRHAV